jgi:GT2 family glycosyltransferase
MSISGQNLSVVIVTLKSEKVINKCINSIGQNVPIIVVENSNNQKFKHDLESKYKNLKCILSGSNLGMGAGNNIGIKAATTDYVFILNPDATLQSNTLDELYLMVERSEYESLDFSILSPICSDKNFPNYGILNKKRKKYLEDFEQIKENGLPFVVDYVDGFSMLLNKSKFKNNNYFDENFFMYLENNDLCKRVINEGGNIFIIQSTKINHEGGKTVDLKYKNEVELSRNWHWIWSKFYFNKKHFGFFKAIRECLLTYFSSLLKILFYSVINNNFKKKIYLCRVSGFYNALLGKTSWYRPNLED